MASRIALATISDVLKRKYILKFNGIQEDKLFRSLSVHGSKLCYRTWCAAENISIQQTCSVTLTGGVNYLAKCSHVYLDLYLSTSWQKMPCSPVNSLHSLLSYIAGSFSSSQHWQSAGTIDSFSVIRVKVIQDQELYSSMHKNIPRDVHLHATSTLPISSATQLNEKNKKNDPRQRLQRNTEEKLRKLSLSQQFDITSLLQLSSEWIILCFSENDLCFYWMIFCSAGGKGFRYVPVFVKLS